MRIPYLMGNWKMNQLVTNIDSFFEFLPQNIDSNKVKCALAPQAVHIPYVLEKCKKAGIEVGAQNISNQLKGAFTGENSIEAIKDLGAGFTLIGHSERRTLFNEEDAYLNEKFKLCMKNNFKAVFCIGETLEQREANETQKVLETQLREGLRGLQNDHLVHLVIAYEPVWAIGTGLTADPDQANEAHEFIRSFISEHFKVDGQKVWILYGGSVKPSNVEELLAQPDIDGALIGGASLEGASYFEMVEKALSN